MTASKKIAELTPEQKRLLLEQLLQERARVSRRVPLSFAQQRLWFLDKLQPNSPAYNIPTILRLRGNLALTEFTQALQQIVHRHEALRTTFQSGPDDTPYQRINPPGEVTIPLKDFSGLQEPLKTTRTKAEINRFIRNPFDLSRDLMIRAELIRLGSDEHLLLLVTHHIASDEWSLKILFEEWGLIYSALLARETPQVRPLPMQYSEYTLWQRDQLQGEFLEEQLSYWRKKLKGPLPTLDLPAVRVSNSAAQEGAIAQLPLDPRTVEKLTQLGRQEEATPFTALVSAFAVLLHRYTSQEDLLFGSPIAGRTRYESEQLIGFFVNTLVFRAAVAPENTFRDVLKAMRQTTCEAYAHQELPFDKLVEEIKPDRTSNTNPLVQVAFSLETELLKEDIFKDLRSEICEADTGTTKFDLTFVVRHTSNSAALYAEYNAKLFSPETITGFLKHYAVLLESILRHPDLPVSQLELLSPEEKDQILYKWNQTETNYPRSECIHQLFERRVAKCPDSVALDYGGEQVTYRELNARANQLAHRLQKLKVGPNTLAGVYMERSPEMVMVFLAILKAGGAYVPLDLSYPKERLAFMMEDAQMPVIITSRDLVEQLPANSAKVILIDSDWSDIAQEPRQLPPNRTNEESLAYVIYTSGSTGRPKGVPVPHRGVTRLVLNTNYIALEPSDVVAQASNASFDAATFEIWGALLNGARLVGIHKDTTLSPQDFARQLRNSKVTTLFVTTALFNQLARETPGGFRTLRHVLFGGEAVDPKWVRSVLECHPPARLLHVYGPTESTTFTSWHLIREVEEDATTVPIGRPISNTQMYILDRQMQPVPAGVAGELYVGGDGLAHGYFNQPDLTAEKFVKHPFIPGAKLYKTGDLARFRPDGEVEFIGRVDHQVKIRGLRIELGEIESLLARHENISNCVVLAREDTPGEKRLAAYFIPKTQPAPTPADLRNHLKRDLPDFMIPSAWVCLKEFPLTPNEKVDRKALPAPDQNRPDLGKTFIAPRDMAEQQLAKVWEKVLGVQPIGVADNFFELGGHSLLAVKLFSQIDRVFGKKLPLATLFRAPTIEQMAKLFREEPAEKSWSTIVDIQPEGAKPAFFWIHSLGGDGGGGFFYYRKLAELLGPDQPSYGIRSPQQPFSKIEEMAAFYIKELRAFQPEGPYNLGGFCFGGVVAYEMACQLVEAGEEVGLLAVLESSPPNLQNKNGWNANNARHSIENLLENVKDFVHHKPEEQMAFLREKGRRLKAKLKGRVNSSQGGEVEAPQLKDVLDMTNYPKDYVKYAETHWSALTRFHPRPFAGPIHVFRARKQGLSNFNHTLGWENIVSGEVRVDVIPGTHESMLQEPNVQILASRLRACLEERSSQAGVALQTV